MNDSYLKKRSKVLDHFGTKLRSGLSKEDFRKKLIKYGKNKINLTNETSKLEIFFNQFKSPLVYVLIFAIFIALSIGHFIDSIIIFIIVILNSIFGYYQEYKAEKALKLLKKVGALSAKVIRSGNLKLVKSEDIVPGDILILEAGDKVPADARLVKVYNLQVNESVLTGESSPVNKKVEVLSKKVIVSDRVNMVFAGTIIYSGRAKAIVTSTSGETEFGKIATSLENITPELTPLQKDLRSFSKKLTLIVVGIVFLLFVIGLLKKIQIIDSLMMSISLAVAAIPEGLPAVVTVTLALGTQRMIKNKVIIRKLSAVETLGSVTTICSDKTGTLTTGNMEVSKIYTDNKIITVSKSSNKFNFTIFGNPYDSNKLKNLFQCAYLCNDSNLKSLIGDPTELALKSVSKISDFSNKFIRINEVPFDPGKKYMVTFDKENNKVFAHMKGAVEIVLDKCKYFQKERRDVYLTSKEKQKILSINNKFAKEGLRVLGFAYSPTGKDNDLIFLGLVGIRDPPRKEVKRSIRICKNAGPCVYIRIVYIREMSSSAC